MNKVGNLLKMVAAVRGRMQLTATYCNMEHLFLIKISDHGTDTLI